MFDGLLTIGSSPLPFSSRREAQAKALGHAVHVVWRRWRTRQAIAGLDATALKDIGVTWAEAEAEANKRFWQR